MNADDLAFCARVAFVAFVVSGVFSIGAAVDRALLRFEHWRDLRRFEAPRPPMAVRLSR